MILPFLSAYLLLPQGSLTASQVLDHVRKAVHYTALARLPNGLQLSGTAHLSGADGSFSLLQGAGGRFVIRYTIPALGKHPQVGGFDGTSSWAADYTGATTPNDPATGGERLMTIDAYTHGWLDPARHYTVGLGAVTDKSVEIDLATGDGYTLATVTIDRSSWLPQSMVVKNPIASKTVTVADYRPELGISLPHSVNFRRGGVTEWLEVKSVEEAPAAPVSEFGMPDWHPTDTTFDPNMRPFLRSVRGPDGHMMVYASIGDKAGWFIFDSGASVMTLDSKVADELELPKVGEFPVAGVGGIVRMHYRPAPEFHLGPATFRDLSFAEYDLGALGDAFGVKVIGIVGYDVFRRTVAELDLASNVVALYDPATYKLTGGTWQPLGFAGKSPYVTASFGEGRSGPFRLDSGASSSVIFHTPAVEKYHLTDGKGLGSTNIGGVGGSASASLGHLDSFTLGGKTFRDPPAIFANASTGLVADRFLVGNIGQPFMESFKVVYDYAHNRIAFVPRQ